ncbi:uncharacterized protein METZ01_LOCUS191038, partial [marine metagenome]
YNRTEPAKPKSAGGGIHDEKPIAINGIQCAVPLPQGAKLKAARFFTPEKESASELQVEIRRNKAHFTLPEFLVYGVAELKWSR